MLPAKQFLKGFPPPLFYFKETFGNETIQGEVLI